MKNFPSTDVTPAPCAANPPLWESRLYADHLQAKAVCDTCPLIVPCWDNLQAVLHADKALGGSPEGTWAGQLFGRQSEGAARRNKPEGVNAA